MKPIKSQYIYKKQIGFTKEQKQTFDILKKYDININNFIRITIK